MVDATVTRHDVLHLRGQLQPHGSALLLCGACWPMTSTDWRAAAERLYTALYGQETRPINRREIIAAALAEAVAGENVRARAAEAALTGLARFRFNDGLCWDFHCHAPQTVPATFPKHSPACLVAQAVLRAAGETG
jgi:hypothetical protein